MKVSTTGETRKRDISLQQLFVLCLFQVQLLASDSVAAFVKADLGEPASPEEQLPWENTDVHDDSIWATSPDAKTPSISRSIDLLAGEPDKSITLIEDDIATDLEENLFRLSLRWDLFPRKKWTNNTIYYRIRTEDYGPREVLLIESALKTFQFLSCLRFLPWDGNTDRDYLDIMNSKERPGCWSYIGKRGGAQPLSLRPPDKKSCHCLCNVGRILHEMMHALGFYHEHTRPDRDNYINIVQENVSKGKLKNFSKKSFDTTTADFDYDYASIMHYGPLFFSKDKKGKKSTIVPRTKAEIGQRNMLSKVDCMKLNHVFGCFNTTDSRSWQNEKIQILCGVLGV